MTKQTSLTKIALMLQPIFDPIPIRGHTLLCLQGFRGKGYSPAFVAQLTVLTHRLFANPDQAVQVIQRPDHTCASCPHLRDEECRLNGVGTETAIRKQDKKVMARLGISKGLIYAWREILHRVAGKIKGDALAEICGHCQWLPLGFCRVGIERLRRQLSPCQRSKG